MKKADLLTKSAFVFFGEELCFGGHVGVDHDASAIFANDDFLAHANVHLTLWRNLVEATTAGVTLDGND